MLNNKRIIDERADFYQLIMLGMIEIVLVVILIQFVFSVNNYRQKAEESYIQMLSVSAERVQSEIETVVENVNNLAFSISFDNEVNDILYNRLPLNTVDKSRISKKLLRYGVADYINSVYIYNADTDEFTGGTKRGGSYVNDELKKVVTSNISEMENADRNGFIYLPINMRELRQAERVENYIAVIYFPVSGNASSIIITIGCDYISDIVAQTGEILRKNLIITDSSNKVIYGGVSFGQEAGEEWNKLSDGINTKSGYAEVKNISKSTGFKFLCRQRMNTANDIFSTIKGNLISILGLLIAIGAGLLLSFFVIKRVASPIKVLQSNYMKNKDKLRQLDKKRIVQSLIMVKDKAEMETMLKKHRDLIFDIEDTVVIVMITIDNFDDMREKSKIDEFDAYTYSVENVFGEIASEFGKSIEILNETKSILIISNAGSDSMDGFLEGLRRGKEILKSELDISVSIAVGSHYNIYEIYYAYNKIKQISQKRYLRGYGSVIIEDECIGETDETGIGSITGFRDCLIKRDYDEANRLLQQFFVSLKKSDSVSFAKIKLVELFMAFVDTVNIMQMTEEDVDFIQSTFYDDINTRETLEEAWQGLQMLVEYISKGAALRSNKQNTVNAVVEIVENEFSNPALCVDDISDRFNLSTFYLNKVFKNDMKTTIPAYILQYRLGKACEMLENTNMTVKEILFKTGFVNASYFGVVFKKHYGITPANYRKLYGKK